MSGFKKKVMRLRERNIVKIERNRSCALFLLIFFGILWISALTAANVYDHKFIIEYSKTRDKTILRVANKFGAILDNFNSGGHVDYYSEKKLEHPFFVVDFPLKGGLLQSNLQENDDKAIVKQYDEFTRWYLIIGMFWWMFCIILIAIHKSLYKKRVVAVSLAIAFIYILMICIGFMLIGYKLSAISFKSEVCIQAHNITEYNQVFSSGNGITAFLKDLNDPYVIEKAQDQLVALKFASNSAYTIYLNRLIALGDVKTFKKIQSGKLVKTLMNDFKSRYITDAVLKEQYYILQDVWKAIMAVRYVLSPVGLRVWSYNYADNVCYTGNILDLISCGLFFFVILGVLFAFNMAWGSEYILRCVIYEEKSNIDMNKNRYDWS